MDDALNEDNYEKANAARLQAEQEIDKFVSAFENKTMAEILKLAMQRSIDMELQSYKPINKIRLVIEKDIENEINLRFPHNKKSATKLKIEMLKILQDECRKNDPIDKIRSEMQLTIDMTWQNDDPKIKEYRNNLFPSGKPTVEEFIKKIANQIKE